MAGIPDSVTTTKRAADRPVVVRIRHNALALERSVRASIRTTSESGALTKEAGSAGMVRTRWPSRFSAGRTEEASSELNARIIAIVGNLTSRGFDDTILTGLYDGLMAPLLTNVVPSWGVMVLGGFFLLVAAPTESLISGLVAVLAAAVVVAMVLQILVYREQGLVSRLSLALTGNVLLTLGFAVAFHLVGPVQ